jgi:serine/threonine protein phosphatase PrpC
MRFELLDSISLPGHPAKPNEDSFSHAEHFACVFDGATVLGENLMPGSSDAQWIAQFGARRLRAHAESTARPREALHAATADAKKSFNALRKRAPAEPYEMPYASLMALFIRDGRMDALWFGDCGALMRATSGEVSVLGDTAGSRSRERDRVSRLAHTDGVAATEVRDKFLPALRASRNHVNMKGGAWLFAPDPRCSKHASEARLAPPPGSLILLASDGFFALVSDYARYTMEQLLAAAQSRGLAKLGQELREIEAADPKGVVHPRFKSSDDATALLLSLSGD